MKLYTYRESENGPDRLAASLDGRTIYPLEALGLRFYTMNELIAAISPDVLALLAARLCAPAPCQPLDWDKVHHCAPIPHPIQDIICLGVNYRDHAEEADAYNPDAFTHESGKPVFYAKRVNESNRDGGIVPIYPGLVTSLDYEVELGVIIGKTAWRVPRERVREYIFGYTIVNDLSDRILQTEHKQWFFGKSLDGYAAMGPCIVTADEFAWPPKLHLSCTVNGEVRQDSNTAYMLHGIDKIIADLSDGMTLHPGTVISTGTPAGVGMGLKPPRFLKPGDVVVCSVEGIGTLTNHIALADA